MVLGIALFAIMIAMDPASRVLSLVSYAWAGFGGAFGPVILLSLWYKGMTRNGALAGMIVGAVTVIVWNHFAWFGLYEIIPAFIFNAITIFVVSAMGQKPSAEMEKTYDEVIGLVKAGKDYEAA
jgi:sodium/proline symporter